MSLLLYPTLWHDISLSTQLVAYCITKRKTTLTELALLYWITESERALIVLDVVGKKLLRKAKNTHTRATVAPGTHMEEGRRENWGKEVLPTAHFETSCSWWRHVTDKCLADTGYEVPGTWFGSTIPSVETQRWWHPYSSVSLFPVHNTFLAIFNDKSNEFTSL